MHDWIIQPLKKLTLPLMLTFASLEVESPFALWASQLKWVYLSTPAMDTLGIRKNNAALQYNTISPQGHENSQYFCFRWAEKKETHTNKTQYPSILGLQTNWFLSLAKVTLVKTCQLQKKSRTEMITKTYLVMSHFFITTQRFTQQCFLQ